MAIGSQEHFDKVRLIQENVKLFNAMKHTHPTFFTKMIKIFEGQEDTKVNMYKVGNNTCVEYVPSLLFKDLFGPIVLTFDGDIIKSGNLIDITPREYFYDSFRSGHREYKGVVIPNVEKYKFMVDLMIVKNGDKYDITNKMADTLKKR